MEKRVIIVKNSQNQQTVKLETAVETLGELKNLLSSQYDMSFENATFHEGKTKSSFNDDAALLPTNIKHNGTITNDLMFLVVTKNKKIASGSLSRVELFNYIKKNKLQDAVKEEFGKNFTTCKTTELGEFVEVHQQKNAVNIPVEKPITQAVGELIDTDSEAAKLVIIPNVREAFEKLTEFLIDNGAIDEDEADEVLEVLGSVNEVSVKNTDNNVMPVVQDAIEFDDDAFAFVQ